MERAKKILGAVVARLVAKKAPEPKYTPALLLMPDAVLAVKVVTPTK